MDPVKKPKHTVHHTLAHSYLVYFILLIIGVLLDFFFHVNLFDGNTMRTVGLVFLGLSTVLIFWAQHTSLNLRMGNVTKETFYKGPYKYTRTPTHFGLFFLILGFGFVMNASFIIGLTILSFVITKIFFITDQEEKLEEKYGQAYLDYKKIVKL